MFLVIDETKRTPGTVGRVVSRHTTQRAAEVAAKAIQHHLRRVRDQDNAVTLKVYQSDTALAAGALAPADLAQPIGESDPLA